MQKVEQDIFSILHKASWFEVPIDNDGFINYIEKVVTLLATENVPEESEGCRACAYRKKGY